MQDNTLVSIIVPIYKVEQYLDACVQSLVDQSYTNLGIILVDDGSPDNCGAMCDAWAQKNERIRVIHQKNGGLSAARNAGLDTMTGNLVSFLDSDDVLHPEAIERLLNALVRDGSDIAVSRLFKFADDVPAFPALTGDFETISGLDAMRRQYQKDEPWTYVSSCGKLFRAELFDDLSFPPGRLFEDEYTTYRILYRAASVSVTDDRLYGYYRNTDSITYQLNLQKHFDEFDAQWDRLAFYRTHQLEPLIDLGLYAFLLLGEWTMKAIRERQADADPDSIDRFCEQFRECLCIAHKRHVTNIADNISYYALAWPDRIAAYRIVRLLTKPFHRKETA